MLAGRSLSVGEGTPSGALKRITLRPPFSLLSTPSIWVRWLLQSICSYLVYGGWGHVAGGVANPFSACRCSSLVQQLVAVLSVGGWVAKWVGVCVCAWSRRTGTCANHMNAGCSGN
jgi:hypothetical protein